MTESLNKLLAEWRSDPGIGANIVKWHTITALPARFKDFPDDLLHVLQAALHVQGIQQLYLHQSLAWQAIQAGKHVVVATGTASGKTLSYNLPILQKMLCESNARALYLFPTKALTQDQSSSLQKLLILIDKIDRIEKPTFAIYDGDTPLNDRPSIRKRAKIILSNPDMLHAGILPHHAAWAEFFQNLRFIVIDEMHVYRGVFGSHFANVIRRLKRITSFYGTNPQFILTSATIANPHELAIRLLEPKNPSDVVVIDQDGSARGKKHFLFYNPPIINPELGLRRSSLYEGQLLAEDLLKNEIQTIIFTQSRRSVEILLTYLRQGVQSSPGANRSAPTSEYIRGYRSGYLPQERREIELGLRDGRVRAVVATNALELGIDIGSMDAAILIGYPGSITSTWQQAGRAGRNESASLAILVASANPLDQYLASHPDYFFSRPIERVLINPDNPLILLGHIRCAAFELPFYQGAFFGNLPEENLVEFLDFLVNEKILHHSQKTFFWMSDQLPARGISLRSTSPSTVTLQINQPRDQNSSAIIGEIDQASALWMTHPQAVYLHEGQTYLVNELNLDEGIAHLSPSNVDYYTQDISNINVQLLQVLDRSETQGAAKYYGEINVTRRVTGYRKVRWYTNEILSIDPLDLPPTELFTSGYWLVLDDSTVDALRSQGLWSNDPNQYGPNWPAQRDRARARDGYRCQLCSLPEQGRTLDVHHKIPFRTFHSYDQANALDNLITLCSPCHRRVEIAVRIRSGLSGLGFSLSRLAPLLLMCDSSDLGVHSDPQSTANEGKPTVIIYDQAPGGLGLSQVLYEVHNTLLDHARKLVSDCLCNDGCPSCVGPGGENGLGGKRETLAILHALTNSPTSA